MKNWVFKTEKEYPADRSDHRWTQRNKIYLQEFNSILARHNGSRLLYTWFMSHRNLFSEVKRKINFPWRPLGRRMDDRTKEEKKQNGNSKTFHHLSPGEPVGLTLPLSYNRHTAGRRREGAVFFSHGDEMCVWCEKFRQTLCPGNEGAGVRFRYQSCLAHITIITFSVDNSINMGLNEEAFRQLLPHLCDEWITYYFCALLWTC